MSYQKITWDGAGKRYLETGTDHGILFLQDAEGKYPKGIAWNGLTGVTQSPEGAEATDFWADNIKYASLRSAETFGGTITAYTYPDEFEACMGFNSLTEGVYYGQQEHKTFGFAYRTKIYSDTGFAGYKMNLVYGATANPSERAHTTENDSPEAVEFSWEFDTVPVAVEGGNPTACLIIDSRVVSEAAWTALETALIGDGSSKNGYLPLPDEVKTIITSADE